MLRRAGGDGTAQSQDLMKHQHLCWVNPAMAESHTKAFFLPLSLVLRSLHPSEKFFPDFVSLEAPGVRINLYIGQAEEAGNMFVCS